jgi:CubicO group peptidase (beta-lactamase class C family)
MRSPTRRIQHLICLAGVTIVTAGVAVADEIPDTPAGEQLAAFLRAVETSSLETYVRGSFSEKFFEKHPKEDVIDFLRQVHEMHGGFASPHIEQSSDYIIVAVMKSNQRDGWRRITIHTDEDAPYRVVGFDIERAEMPEGVAVNTPPPSYARKDSDPGDTTAIVRGETAEKIDRYLRDIERRGYSGAVLAAKSGEIILAKGYGWADRDNRIPFTSKTVFTVGSITKQFTAAAILKLEMMGTLTTDDLITEYLDNVPADKQGITLHHLLTHSAGFPGAIGHDFDTITREEYIDTALTTPLRFEPGRKFSYSNVGYSLLAAIVEMTSGQSYDAFTRQYLFEPAEMLETGYVLPRWKAVRFAHGYSKSEHWGAPRDQNWAEDGPYWHLRGNGGALSTVHDMYKWHRALMGEEILSEAAKAKLYGKHIALGPEGEEYYGYGWDVMKSGRGTDVVKHDGGNPYFLNNYVRYLDDDAVVYMMTNNPEFDAIERSYALTALLFE